MYIYVTASDPVYYLNLIGLYWVHQLSKSALRSEGTVLNGMPAEKQGEGMCKLLKVWALSET